MKDDNKLKLWEKIVMASNNIYLDKNERILIIIRDLSLFEKIFTGLTFNVIVITNKRIFTIGKYTIQQTFFRDIESCRYIKKTKFKYSKLSIDTKDGQINDYKFINYKKAKQYMNYINKIH
jgi:hypothetical protein